MAVGPTRKAASARYSVLCLGWLVACAPSPPERPFTPAASFERVREQHRRLPTDDIWWTVHGEDMAWNFKNLHQLFPTVNVYRGGDIAVLARRPMTAIADFRVDTPSGPMRFADFIASEQSTTLGVVILHRGEMVFEAYPRLQEYEMPVFWSVAKIFPATLLRILEERGELDVEKPIESYLPELSGSSFAGVSVRDLLDMASGLDCEDAYETRDSCYCQYSVSIGDGFATPGSPDDPYAFVAGLQTKRVAPPGEVFSYSGVNTFVLAWLVEKLTGLAFQDVLSREIWYRMGAEADASYIAPNRGVAVTHGGFLARMRDMARFGLLFTPSAGVVTDREIISKQHIEFLQTAGNPELMRNAGYPDLAEAGIKHNIYQWDAVYENGTLEKGGWAGQGLVINPEWDVVAVFTGYFKDAQRSETPLQPRLMQVLRGVFGEGAGRLTGADRR